MSNIDVDGISERLLTAHLLSMPYDAYSVVSNYVAAIRDENAKLLDIIKRILADYACCADELYARLRNSGVIVKTYRIDGATTMERIKGTTDGAAIDNYLAELKRMGHDL